MFGFGWVEHTWEMFLWRVYEFSFYFGWISGKMDEISKYGQFQGPTSRRREPTQQRKSTPKWVCLPHGAIEREA